MTQRRPRRLRNLIRKIYFCIAVAALPAIASAAAQAGTDDTAALYTYVKSWYDRLLLPAGTILAGIVIMYGGISYAMSAGDPSKVQKAKEYIYGAITGLVLLICAALIVRTVIT